MNADQSVYEPKANEIWCEHCGELAGKEGGAVAVKVAKESHDMRFDIPCIGPRGPILNRPRRKITGFRPRPN